MVIKRDIFYTPAGKIRTLHIHLPENYDQTDDRYPVIYFFDGHNLFRDEDATYGKSWGLENFLNSWYKPMIIVGFECGHEGNERLDEYSPYSFSNPYFGNVHGIGEDTFQWIVSEVKPVIDRDYRTLYFREATGIAGSSMGGLMALYGVVRFNRWFSKAACLSSAITMCQEQLHRDIDRSDLSPDTRVYLSWGTEEAGGRRGSEKEDYETAAARRNRSMAVHLQTKAVVTELYCQLGGGHCEADWEKQIPEFMDFLWSR